MDTVTSFLPLAEAIERFRQELVDPRWAFGILRAVEDSNPVAALWLWDAQGEMWEGYYNARYGTFVPLRKVADFLFSSKDPAHWWHLAITSGIPVLAARFPAP